MSSTTYDRCSGLTTRVDVVVCKPQYGGYVSCKLADILASFSFSTKITTKRQGVTWLDFKIKLQIPPENFFLKTPATTVNLLIEIIA